MQYLYFLLYSWTIIMVAGISTVFSEASIFPESMLSILFIALSPIIYVLIKYVKDTSTIQLKLKRLSFYRVAFIMLVITVALFIFQPDFLTLTCITIGLATIFFGTDTRIIFILGFIESICVIALLFFEQNIVAEYMLTELFYVLLVGAIVTPIGTNIAQYCDQLLKGRESIIHGWKQKVSLDEVIQSSVLYLPYILMLLSIYSVLFSPIGDIYYVVVVILYLFAFFSNNPVIISERSLKDILFLVITSLSIFLIFYSYSLAEAVIAVLSYISIIFLFGKKRGINKKFQLFFK